MDSNNTESSTLEYSTVIANEAQLLQAYPDWFKKINVDILPFYIEKPPARKDGAIKTEHAIFRYVITPSGIVRVGSKDNEILWNIDEGDLDFFSKVHTFAKNEKFNIENEKKNSFDTQIFLNKKDFFVQYMPYGDPDVSSNVLMELESNHSIEKMPDSGIE